MTCRELMTPNPAVCQADDSVVAAAMMMKSGDVGAIPVVTDRTSMRLSGIVTDRDLAIKVIAEQRDMYKSKVEDVMTTDLYICKPADDFDDVLKMMSRHQIRRIPVVDDNQRIIGIISQADIAVMPNRRRTSAGSSVRSRNPMASRRASMWGKPHCGSPADWAWALESSICSTPTARSAWPASSAM